MAISGQGLVDHIAEHEILGVDSSLSYVKVSGDILWVRDNTRNKWLSADRFYIFGGRAGRISNAYLKTVGGLATSASSYRIARDATITGIAVQTRNPETWTLRVRKNGTLVEVAQLYMNGVNGNHNMAVDGDLNEGDTVQLYASTTAFSGIKDPLVWIEIAWRNDSL